MQCVVLCCVGRLTCSKPTDRIQGDFVQSLLSWLGDFMVVSRSLNISKKHIDQPERLAYLSLHRHGLQPASLSGYGSTYNRRFLTTDYGTESGKRDISQRGNASATKFRLKAKGAMVV